LVKIGYAYYLRGLCYATQGKDAEALEDLVLSCRTNFYGVDAALYARAVIVARANDYAAACNFLVEALLFDPDNLAYHELLEQFNKASGMQVAAIQSPGDATGGFRQSPDFIHPQYFDSDAELAPELMPVMQQQSPPDAQATSTSASTSASTSSSTQAATPPRAQRTALGRTVYRPNVAAGLVCATGFGSIVLYSGSPPTTHH
jgi:tetratricopeptide (TPR) repeat protein